MNVLIIGYGSIAKKHIVALNKVSSGVNYFALRSNTGMEETEGITNIYDWESLPKNIDFAIVSTPTFRHTEFVEILCGKRIPIFLEKPISHMLTGLSALSEKIILDNVPTYVACNLRFSPALRFLHEYLHTNKKRINEVLVYAGSHLPSWRPGINFRDNYSANAEMGGGVHLDMFHELDYTTWLFGQPRKSRSTLRNVSSLGISAVDFASFTWEYDEFTATILLNYYRKKAKRTVEIIFDDEIWEVDILRSKITNDQGEVVFEAINYDLKETYVSQMSYFIECIRQKIAPKFNTFGYSLEILKNCLKEYETGK